MIGTKTAEINATYRSGGAVGKKAVLPRLISKFARKGEKILDFGAGTKAIHTKRLRSRGYNVTAYDFGANRNELYDSQALSRKYKVVMASNVLNVQPTDGHLRRTLRQIKRAIAPRGFALVNYPYSPRKMSVSSSKMEEILKKTFSHVEPVAGESEVWKVS